MSGCAAGKEHMDEISGKAYGKINLSLDVVGRREDGYHLVRMIMQTVDIYDTITIRKTEEAGIALRTDSGVLPADPSNLVWRAADVMCRAFGLSDGLEILLEKRIPIAAGMAGGSADAAAVFRLLRTLYGLDAPDERLEELSLPLGADIPFCIKGGTQLCEGIGEVLTPLPAPPKVSLVVCKPNLYVATPWVYRAYDSIPEEKIHHPDVDGMVQSIRQGDLSAMCRGLGNVLEQQTGAEYPIIGELEHFLAEHGAIGCRMTGSGPTVFAVYEEAAAADAAYRALRERTEYRDFQCFRTEFITPRDARDRKGPAL